MIPTTSFSRILTSVTNFPTRSYIDGSRGRSRTFKFFLGFNTSHPFFIITPFMFVFMQASFVCFFYIVLIFHPFQIFQTVIIFNMIYMINR